MRVPSKRTVEWSVAIAIAVALFAAGLTLIILGREQVIPSRPWREFGVALGCLAALMGLGLAFAEADIVSGQSDRYEDQQIGDE